MKRKGFTLVELMVVLVIVGIIALVAAPRIGDIIKERKAQSYQAHKYQSPNNYKTASVPKRSEALASDWIDLGGWDGIEYKKLVIDGKTILLFHNRGDNAISAVNITEAMK